MHLTLIVHLYGPMYRHQISQSTYFCWFCVFSASLCLCIYPAFQKIIRMLWNLLYLLHAAFSIFERAEGMSVQPVIVQSVLLNKHWIQSLIYCQFQSRNAKHQVRSEVTALTSNCKLPMWMYFTFNVSTTNLCMQCRTSHVWGEEIEARNRLLTSEDYSYKKKLWTLKALSKARGSNQQSFIFEYFNFWADIHLLCG